MLWSEEEINKCFEIISKGIDRANIKGVSSINWQKLERKLLEELPGRTMSAIKIMVTNHFNRLLRDEFIDNSSESGQSKIIAEMTEADKDLLFDVIKNNAGSYLNEQEIAKEFLVMKDLSPDGNPEIKKQVRHQCNKWLKENRYTLNTRGEIKIPEKEDVNINGFRKQ